MIKKEAIIEAGIKDTAQIDAIIELSRLNEIDLLGNSILNKVAIKDDEKVPAYLNRALIETTDSATKNAYDNVDAAVLKVTSIEKTANEKTSDYLTRSTGEHVTTQLTEKDGEITKLNQKITEGVTDKKLVDENAKLLGDINTLKEEHTTALAGKDTEHSAYKRQGDFKALLPQKFKIGQATIDVLSDIELKKLVDSDVEIRKDDKGVVMLVGKVGEKSITMTPEDYWKGSTLGEHIDGAVNQDGGGADKNEEGKDIPKTLTFAVDATRADKEEQMSEHLNKQGITKIDDSWDEQWKNLSIEAGLREKDVEPKKED